MTALASRTPAGRDLMVLAGRLAAVLAEHADEHDRDGTFPHTSLESLKRSGYLYAPIPVPLGGLGVGSVHDLVSSAVRLARSDASLVIGANMHLLALINLRRRWDMAVAAGDEPRAGAFAAALADIASRRVVMAAAVSELNQDLTRPATEAVRTGDGWCINGHKAFCTMSPGATVLYTAVRFSDGGTGERYGYAMVPADTAGVTIHDDWDALGMRASGTNSVTYEDVLIRRDALRGGFPIGDARGYMARNLPAGPLHAAASLGIAEQAHEHVLGLLRRRAAAARDGRVQTLAAESEMDLAAAQATLSHAAAAIDDHHDTHTASDGPEGSIEALFTAGQVAKAVVAAAAGRVVERAMELSGGAGYRSASPLARAYRDVRAAGFMHPLGANRAYAHIGRAALGLAPELA